MRRVVTSGSAGPALEGKAVTLRRGERVLFRELSWRSAPGAVTLVTGANGTGKSSLLGLVTGLETEAEGELRLITVNGNRPEIRHLEPAMDLPTGGRVGGLAPALGLEDPSRYPLLPPGVRPRSRLRRLSTGERRRLLLTRLLTQPGEFLVLDEPFSNLSDEGVEEAAGWIARVARESVVVLATNRRLPAALGPIEPHLALGEP